MTVAPLVTLDYGGGRAGVVRDDSDGSLWLTHDVTQGGMTGLDDYEPVIIGVEEGTLVGGRAPDAARSAAVRTRSGALQAAELGAQAWLALLDEPARGDVPPVLFRDDAGAIVRRPYPDDAQHVPVPDANEPCPACEAREWELVTYTTRWREQVRQLACARCGHAEHLGVLLQSHKRDEPPPPPPLPVPDIDFPLYGLADWSGPRRFGGWAASGSRVDSASLRHGDEERMVEIETSSTKTPKWGTEESRAREALAGELDLGEAPPSGSDESILLWANVRRREAEAAAARAEAQKLTLAVDGEPVDFVLVRHGDNWAAAATHQGQSLTIRARSIDPDGVALTRIDELPA